MKSKLWKSFAAAGLAATMFVGVTASATPAEAGNVRVKVKMTDNQKQQIKRRILRQLRNEALRDQAGKNALKPWQAPLPDSMQEASTPFDREIDTLVAAGITDGSLTRYEAWRLRAIHHRFRIMRRLMKHDRDFSAWEQQHIANVRKAFAKVIGRERLDGNFRVGAQHLALRLAAGVKEGAIPKEEATRLQAGIAGVEFLTKTANTDGVLSKSEKARIYRASYRLGLVINQHRRLAPARSVLGEAGFRHALHKGINEGMISWREARMLRVMHARVRNMKKSAASDGTITAAEARQIQNARFVMRRMVQQASNPGAPGPIQSTSSPEGVSGVGSATRSYGQSISRGLRGAGSFYGGLTGR